MRSIVRNSVCTVTHGARGNSAVLERYMVGEAVQSTFWCTQSTRIVRLWSVIRNLIQVVPCFFMYMSEYACEGPHSDRGREDCASEPVGNILM